MKTHTFKSLIIVGLLFISSIAVNAQSDFSLARVNKVNDKMFFYNNEPTSEYEISFTFSNVIKNINCKNTQEIMSETVANANIEKAAQDKKYDAIIVGTSTRDIAIIWKDKSKDNSIARVKKEQGKWLFIECEPISNYDVVDNFTTIGKAQKIWVGTCPPFQKKIDNLIKRASKGNCDAIMYGSSRNEISIKFK